jgi:hypothetical protein
VPDKEAAVPDKEAAVPDKEAAVPDKENVAHEVTAAAATVYELSR